MDLKINEDGIRYYLIPKGTHLYRGDSAYTGESMMLHDQITFFGFDQENVEENYGITYEFVTKKQLKLLAVDKNNSTEFLDIIKQSNKYHEIITILNKNYGYTTGFRDSDARKDNILSEFICEYFPDYDGYACDEMPTKTGHLHQEAMLCSPANKFKGHGKRVTAPNKIQGLREKWELLQHGRQMEEQRKEAKEKNKRSRFVDDRRNLFGFDDEEESSNINLFSDRLKENDDYELPQGRKLFGGKRKRKTKRKKRSKRRKTRTNKNKV